MNQGPRLSPDGLRRWQVLLLEEPGLWPTWPFLPVFRDRSGGGHEVGVLYDGRRVTGLPGHDHTVFLVSVRALPEREAELLAAPRRAFASAREMADAGWLPGEPPAIWPSG